MNSAISGYYVSASPKEAEQVIKSQKSMGSYGVIESGVEVEIAVNGNGDRGDGKEIDSLKPNEEQKSINNGLNSDQKSSK
jgi:hypothetical protein